MIEKKYETKEHEFETYEDSLNYAKSFVCLNIDKDATSKQYEKNGKYVVITQIKVQENENKEVKKKYVQQEINGIPKKRGGWRDGGRPKSTGQTTVAVRIDKKLENLVNALKESLKNGTLDEKEIELLLMRTQKQKGDL